MAALLGCCSAGYWEGCYGPDQIGTRSHLNWLNLDLDISPALVRSGPVWSRTALDQINSGGPTSLAISSPDHRSVDLYRFDTAARHIHLPIPHQLSVKKVFQREKSDKSSPHKKFQTCKSTPSID